MREIEGEILCGRRKATARCGRLKNDIDEDDEQQQFQVEPAHHTACEEEGQEIWLPTTTESLNRKMCSTGYSARGRGVQAV